MLTEKMPIAKRRQSVNHSECPAARGVNIVSSAIDSRVQPMFMRANVNRSVNSPSGIMDKS